LSGHSRHVIHPRMRVLFLDIDGVVNCATTRGRRSGAMGIDPRLAKIVRDIAAAVPDLKVVLSSSWREVEKSRAIVEKRVLPCFDVTPVFDEADDVRGYEIQAWLELNPGVVRYAILDDDCDMLPHQLRHFFRTRTEIGITRELADRIIAHLTA
jgi:hypothetical protein